MKSQTFFLLILISVFVFSCTDDLTDVGTSIHPTSDQISLGTDTFHVSTGNIFVDNMYSQQDSFLLGNFYDAKYGSTKADIFAQLNCPIGFVFPPNSVADSSKVMLYYRSWFGDSYSPLDVSIYEMNKSTFSYTVAYPSNLDPTVYTDKTIRLGRRVFSAKDAVVLRTDTTGVEFKMSQDFVTRFFNVKSDTYSSESKFTDFFKGLYITGNFGASTILNVSQISLYYYYHYTYITKSSTGADSTVTVNNVLTFPANSEVRQVNRFAHVDRSAVVKEEAGVNYIASPANLHTSVTIPMVRINSRLNAMLNNKKLALNAAILKVEATDIDSATLAMPLVANLLLVKESEKDRFFTKNKVFSDTCAIRGTLAYALNDSTGVYDYYYSFNIAKLIATECKNNPNTTEDLKMRLIPVRVKTNSSSVVTSVKQQFLMSAVKVRSGKNTESPMKISLIYSGF